MKKILIILMLFLVASAFAQDDKQKNPGVELPDFVITGKENVSIQNSSKIKPDFVPIISEEFIKPIFSPEQLETKDLSNPVKEEINLFDSLNFYKGRLKVGAGLYTLPEAQVSLWQPFSSGLFNAGLSAYNKRAYVENSDRFGVRANASINYFVDADSKFLPGSELKVEGSYGINSYKLFASDFPTVRRSFGLGNASLQFNYLTSKILISSIKIEDEFASLNDVTYSENIIKFSGMSKLQLSNFAVGAHAKLISASLNNSIFSNAKFGFANIRPFIGLNMSDAFKATFGMDFEFYESKTIFNPYASIGIKLDKSISLFAEYAPHTEFSSVSSFLKQNGYLQADSSVGLFFDKRSSFRGVVKYEYGKYFEIDGGFEYTSSSNYPYFVPAATNGEFTLVSTDAKRFEGFINLLFHSGPYGMFYGSVHFSDTRDTVNNILPYSPALTANLNYSINFNKKYNAGVTVEFISGGYTDLTNIKKVDGLFDLGLNFGYRINEKFVWTLEAHNLINRNNYIWNGYKEFPMDIAAGFKYQW
ncbi:MAG: hypothetical protein K8H86_12490 [Ignavibacteriaceae bacterium]|nr:hypothetical protein [Ignavibacteriaceae bacterium]